MNPDDNYKAEDYKKCAGKGCSHTGNTILRIKFIQKEGAFCKDCATDLLNLGLVEEKKIEEVRN
jgi:hypothetical protein